MTKAPFPSTLPLPPAPGNGEGHFTPIIQMAIKVVLAQAYEIQRLVAQNREYSSINQKKELSKDIANFRRIFPAKLEGPGGVIEAFREGPKNILKEIIYYRQFNG